MPNQNGYVLCKETVEFLIEMTAPPGEELRYDDRNSFIDALACALEDGNELLLEALRKKWPEAVEAHYAEAERLAKEDF